MKVKYLSQSARDAEAANYGGPSYYAYLDAKAIEYAERFPEDAERFLGRSLGESLSGNDGI